GAFGDGTEGGRGLPGDSAVVAMLSDMTIPLDLTGGSIAGVLPPSDRAWTIANGVAFAAAVRRRDEHIAAILAWGPKRDGRGFNRRDRWLVMTLTSAAAAAWNVEPPAENRMATDQPAFECPDCGLVGDSAPLQCSCACKVALAALPRRVGRNFIVERRLGAGGMGVV